MIIFGVRASNIGNFGVPNSKCRFCKKDNTLVISVFGKYAHIFWIPFFPIGKKPIAGCTHCKGTIEHKAFSPQLKKFYRTNKKTVKRPFWHWIGLGLLALLISVITFVGATSKKDPRSVLFTQDEANMIGTPTMESDSISYKIKQVFDLFVTEEIDPSEFKYLTKVTDDKALILVQIPQLKKIEKEGRLQALEIVEMIAEKEQSFENKDLYIGIKGSVTMMIIKTPTFEENSSIVGAYNLYEFYGPKPIAKK